MIKWFDNIYIKAIAQVLCIWAVLTLIYFILTTFIWN